MRSFSGRSLFGGLVLGAGLGTALTPAFADEVIITREPPPLRTEVMPVRASGLSAVESPISSLV